MQDTKGKVIFSLLAGATAGIITGLLLAPETGDETRSGLKKSASKLSEDLSKLLNGGLSRFGNAVPTSQQESDRSVADQLLNSLGSSATASPQPDPAEAADSDYDGIGSDTRHSAGYGRPK